MRDNVDIVRGVYEAFARGDLAGLLEVLDREVEWFEATGFPTVGGRHVGPAAVAEVLGRVVAEWDDLTVTADAFFHASDRVVVLGETRGRHRATSKEFRSPFAHEWHLRDCRIVLWRAYIDTALAQAAARAD